jgi:MoaA/NifB/PqqE/SkfB family radical SAM enzyme
MMIFHAAKNGESMISSSSYVVKQINKEEIKIYDRCSLNEAKIPKENLDKLNLDKIRYGPVDYVDIAITGKCNLKCKHCYQGDQKYSYELDYKTIEKTIYDAYDLGVIGIVLTGGEPTLHPNFVDIIKLLDELNFRWTLVTNGNYDKKLNKYILKYKPVEVAFSLDGLKPEYEKFRIGGNWEKVIENIKTLSKEIITQVNCTLNKYTSDPEYIKKFEKFVKNELNVDKITYVPIGLAGYACKNTDIIPKKIWFPKKIYNRNGKLIFEGEYIQGI